MFQKIKNSMVAIALLLLAAAPLAVPTLAHADNITDSLCKGTNIATGDDNTPTNIDNVSANCESSGNGGVNAETGLYSLAKKIVNIFSVIVGIVAVLMIIFGGFKYITSGGDSGKVSGAKNSLIYAIIGLIIVALAQFIVHYVLSTAGGITSAQ